MPNSQKMDPIFEPVHLLKVYSFNKLTIILIKTLSIYVAICLTLNNNVGFSMSVIDRVEVDLRRSDLVLYLQDE